MYFQTSVFIHRFKARDRLAVTLAGFRLQIFVKTAKNSKRRMIKKKQCFLHVSPEQFIRPKEFGV